MDLKPIQIDFTNRDLRRLIVPLVIEQLLAITVGLLDSVMVSQVGEAALAVVQNVDGVGAPKRPLLVVVPGVQRLHGEGGGPALLAERWTDPVSFYPTYWDKYGRYLYLNAEVPFPDAVLPEAFGGGCMIVCDLPEAVRPPEVDPGVPQIEAGDALRGNHGQRQRRAGASAGGGLLDGPVGAVHIGLYGLPRGGRFDLISGRQKRLNGQEGGGLSRFLAAHPVAHGKNRGGFRYAVQGKRTVSAVE